MTYAQLAAARGITRASAERLARNRKWPRVRGNDGVAIVIVPPGESSPGSGAGSSPGKPGRRRPPGSPPPDPLPDIRGAIEAAVTPLRELLTAANQRADQAERRLADKDATITGLVAEQQAMRQQVELLREILGARRGWWRRVFGR